MEQITPAKLAAAGGAPDCTHAVFNAEGSLYFCVRLSHEIEETEAEYWRNIGYIMKRVKEI